MFSLGRKCSCCVRICSEVTVQNKQKYSSILPNLVNQCTYSCILGITSNMVIINLHSCQGGGNHSKLLVVSFCILCSTSLSSNEDNRKLTILVMCDFLNSLFCP